MKVVDQNREQERKEIEKEKKSKERRRTRWELPQNALRENIKEVCFGSDFGLGAAVVKLLLLLFLLLVLLFYLGWRSVRGER